MFLAYVSHWANHQAAKRSPLNLDARTYVVTGGGGQVDGLPPPHFIYLLLT